MSLARVILRSLRYYWRSNAAVVLGAAIGVAVLVGSLTVGDSVDASLREQALERLGRITYLLRGPAFLREGLAEDLSQAICGRPRSSLFVPLIVLEGTARTAEGEAAVPRVNVFGVPHAYDRLLYGPTPEIYPDVRLGDLSGRHVAINRHLADDLGVAEGDALLVAFPRQGAVPADTVFAHRDREHTLGTVRVVVRSVLPARGIGVATFRTDDPRPRDLFVALPWLQRQLHRPGQVNAIATTWPSAPPAGLSVLSDALAKAVRLEDLGLRLVSNEPRGTFSLESDRLVLPAPVVQALGGTNAPGVTSVYLANTVALLRDGATASRLPYAVVAGLDPRARPPLGPLPMADGSQPPALAPGDILLNAWAAEDLGAQRGDALALTFYVAGERGELDTATRRFTLRGVVAMRGAALDPGLVPEFRGITDADSMAGWDPPFPIDRSRIRPKDEVYWDEHRATPKAFVAPEEVATLWRGAERGAGVHGAGGWVTSIRLAPEGGEVTPAAARAVEADTLGKLPLGELGLRWRAVRHQALQAAEGSTDFGVLFLAMSIFLVAASAALVFLLLRLTAERRAGQFGILLATGFTARHAAGVLVGEGVVLALAGAAVGVPLGVGYAGGILQALRTWWTGAVGEFAFSLHVRAGTLVLGAAAGLAVAVGALVVSARALRRAEALSLLSGWRAMAARPRPRTRRRAGWVAWVAFAAAAGLLVLSVGVDVVSPTAAFFGIGSALLVGALAAVGHRLQRPRVAVRRVPSLPRLALREAAGRWLRSVLTMGLLAAASFLIVTVAANRKDLSRVDTRDRSSGAGGFNLVARSSVPIHADLGTDAGRQALGFAPDGAEALAAARIVPLRATEGEDASCLNMNRPQAPRVLGVPRALVERGGFAFASHEPVPEGADSPWSLLEHDLPDGAVPAFADAASAQWILKTGLGEELAVPGPSGTVRLRLVGLLAGSIFQSEVLIAERHFRERFGPDAGYRVFLVRTPPAKEEAVVRAFRQGLGELTFDVQRTADVLARFARVQNTYLSTFETLGGLGLLLGTFGTVAVLLRSVIERRSELAMMLAIGFRSRVVFARIVMENALLLLLGVAIGTAAALVAVAPHLLSAVAAVRWLPLAGTLGVCVAAGVAACSLAAAVALRGNLLDALRSE